MTQETLFFSGKKTILVCFDWFNLICLSLVCFSCLLVYIILGFGGGGFFCVCYLFDLICLKVMVIFLLHIVVYYIYSCFMFCLFSMVSYKL